MNKQERKHNLFLELENLDAVEKRLRDKGEIVVSFSREELQNAEYVIRGAVPGFEGHAARQYIGAKTLQALEEKYPLLKREYNGSKNLSIFQQGDREAYEEKSSYIYNTYDVKDILDVEDIHPGKVSYIVRGESLEVFRPGFLPLLDDNAAFDVDLYLAQKQDIDFLTPEPTQTEKGK